MMMMVTIQLCHCRCRRCRCRCCSSSSSSVSFWFLFIPSFSAPTATFNMLWDTRGGPMIVVSCTYTIWRQKSLPLPLPPPLLLLLLPFSALPLLVPVGWVGCATKLYDHIGSLSCQGIILLKKGKVRDHNMCLIRECRYDGECYEFLFLFVVVSSLLSYSWLSLLLLLWLWWLEKKRSSVLLYRTLQEPTRHTLVLIHIDPFLGQNSTPRKSRWDSIPPAGETTLSPSRDGNCYP